MDYNWIFKTFEFAEEPDLRYFQPTSNGYKISPSFVKIIAEDAVSWFEEMILKLDTENKYSDDGTKVITDEEATRKNKEKFKKQYELYESKWEQYKSSHANEFVERETVDGTASQSLHKRSIKFKPDISINLADAIRGWKASKELAKKYGKGGDEYASLPTYIQIVSAPEFTNEHKAVRAKWRTELGLPESDTELVVKKEVNDRHLTIRINSTSIKQFEADGQYLEEFAEQYVDFMKELD